MGAGWGKEVGTRSGGDRLLPSTNVTCSESRKPRRVQKTCRLPCIDHKHSESVYFNSGGSELILIGKLVGGYHDRREKILN